MPTPFYPGNDFAMTVKLYDVDQETAARGPLTTGSVTAFIAASNLPDAEPAEATLEVACTHVGAGKWLVFFDGAVLDYELLDGIFGLVSPATPYLIVEQVGGVRTFEELVYTPVRQATVTT